MASDLPGYLTKAGLKARGWTEKAIATFLGDCDQEAKNPVFRSAAPAKLYLTSRVEAAEQSDAYRAFVAGNAGRRTGARKAVTTKRDRLMQDLAGWQIVLRPKPYKTVLDAAIRAYNRFHEDLYYDRGHNYEPASRESSPEFLERITVNHLRHRLTNYDTRLEVLFGRVGKQEAYQVLNEKIYAKIAEGYPMLADECARQLRRKRGEE
ncbi:MAG: hypothetical protein WC262_11975 [Bacteroidales bacterium]|jgi:hypothetical protein